MLRDVFYYGNKPNVHPREKFAKNLKDARNQSTTEHFWIINEFCDYRNFDWDFDFDFLPDDDVWAINHNNIWPSIHQKDSGTWLCAKEHSDILVYRADVEPLKRKNIISQEWKFFDTIDKTKFDFSWHPDPTDPPFIYAWGCKYFPVQLKVCLEYHVVGATNYKYMDDVIELEPNWENIKEVQKIDRDKFDLSWRPNPLDPPYIYVWGNKYIPAELKPTLEYHMPNATEKKYMPEVLPILPENNWIEFVKVDKTKFDFTWRPDPREPAYIYVWGNKYDPAEVKPTLEYHVPGATEKKYMGIVDLEPEWDKWKEIQLVDKSKFDFSWRPDPNLHEPPYIYVWGNKYIPAEIQSTLEYHVPGATEKKYMGAIDVVPELDKWTEIQKIDKSKFDLSWRPDPREPAYIYVWGSRFDKAEIKSAIEYRVPGATEKKYMNESVELLPEYERWIENIVTDRTKFDFSWRPSITEPPYIYVWGNKYIPAEIQSTLEYHVPGATEIKYMGNVEVLPEYDRYKIIIPVDKTKFDFSWRPDPREPAYIYVWGNKYIPGEIKPTLEYHVPGATEIKYMGNVVVLPESDRWTEVQKIDKSKFDLSWRPDPREPAYIYVWGNKYIPAEIQSTLEYRVPNATEKKYMGNVEVLPEYDRYKIIIPVDKTKFDFTWRPDPREPAYIYVWGNQYNSAEVEPTIEYYVPGATNRKYMHDSIASVLPIVENWKILIPVENFDFSWRPNPNDPPYIYVFGNQWYDVYMEPTLEYHVPGAIDRKYITDIIAYVSPMLERYKQLIPVEKFDFSWRPHPHDPPMIYVFGNQWYDVNLEPTLEYHMPGAVDKKYVTDIVAYTCPMLERYKQLIPVENFDYSWRPHPHDPPMIYIFGNQWHDVNLEPTLEYHMPGAVDKKYVTDIVAYTKPDMDNWITNYQVNDFDYSWRPHPHDPPMIYHFGTVLDDIHLKDGPIYSVPGNNGTVVYLDNKVARASKIVYPKYYIKTTLEDLIDNHPKEIFWALRDNINYNNFNFDWTPTKENVFHINVFGSKDSEITQTYFVNSSMIGQGFKQRNYLEDKKIDDQYLTELFNPIDVFYIDKNNPEAVVRYENLKIKFPNIQKTRFLNSWVDTINRCLNKCNTKLCWILNSELDYSNFDFEYYPNPWQLKMVHIFGTQWSNWGTTFIVNKETFNNDTKYIKNIEHLPNINFVKKSKALATNCLYDVYLIDHGNIETKNVVDHLKNRLKTNKIEIIKYNKSYLSTLTNLIESLPNKKDHYLWVCSSVCDYNSFDFSYICDPFSKEQLHVFPSDNQKFGDTFFIDINKFRSLLSDMRLLEDYEKINFNQHQKVKRLDCPVYINHNDTLVSSINVDYDFPYALIKTHDNQNLKIDISEPPALWSEDKNAITVLAEGSTNIFLPANAKKYVKNQLYDYPFITKTNKLSKSHPMDIVFLSNGEINADENYEHLLKATKNLPNKVFRVDGINGRVQAYHAAAEISTTPWMFTVFAKLRVNENFDWNWQPDRLQVPKHYIFKAENPVNGLIYGHQAMIAYNKKLVLANKGKGLDFTLDDEHEVVDILSGIANFNTDPYSTWRTAFREVVKLHSSEDYESYFRLDTWLNVGNGLYSDYALQGARDATDYYNEVNGDLDKLKLSYEWKWLNQYFTNKYTL